MRNKIRIYCDLACLKEIYEQYHKPIADFKQGDNPIIWAKLYQLVYENSELFINLNDNALHKLRTENPIFDKLFKEDNLNAVDNNFEKMYKEDEFLLKINPKTLFLLDKTSDECKKLEEDFGLWFIPKEKLQEKAAMLFSWFIYNIEKNGTIYTNWNFLQEVKYPCNALVITDNYVLENETLLESNLLLLLKQIMPNVLNKQTFHLTVLTKIDLDLKKKSEKIERCGKYLKEELEKHYNSKIKSIEITVIHTKAIHDRHILTNYSYITSGYGFTLFENNKATKNTTVFACISTYLQNKHDKSNSITEIINSIQKQSKSINENAKNTSPTAPIQDIDFFSSNEKQNRLLS